MADETLHIIRVDTEQSVNNVRELRDYINSLKKSLNDEEASLEDNRKAAERLRSAQAALRDVMYSTVTSAEDLMKASQGLLDENNNLTGSYNDLVKTMASLKSAWRATNDAMTRENLGKEIDRVNSKLKEMDATVGNYQRNVGNYGSALDGLGGILSQFPPTLGATSEQVRKVGATMKLVSTNPLLGIMGLIAPILMKIADALKDNDTALAAMKKAMTALQPVADFFAGILEVIAGWISKAVDYLVDLMAQSSGTFKNIVAGAVGVGNAILQYLLTPIRTVIEAAKGLGSVMKDVFTGQFKKAKEDAKAALGEIGDAFKKGVDFKGNFAAGKAAGEAFIAGLDTNKKKAKESGKGMAKSVTEGLTDTLLKDIEEIGAAVDKELDDILNGTLTAFDEANKKAAEKEKERLQNMTEATARALELNEIEAEDERVKADEKFAIMQEDYARRLAALDEFRAAALERGDIDLALDYEEQAADLRVSMEMDVLREKKRIRKQDEKDAKDRAKAQLTIMREFAGGTSSLLTSIADMYEENAVEGSKTANKVKGLRIAAATIDTLSGAVAAFTSAQEQIGGVPGMIVGAANAAAVVAAGMVNIAKIRATKVGDGGDSSSSEAAASSPAMVNAPTVTTSMDEVRNITSASEEARLNKMAGDQRVYIVSSDIEASLDQNRVQVAESSF